MRDTAEEWSGLGDMLALLSATTFVTIGLILALAGYDPAIRIHGLMLLVASGLAGFYVLANPCLLYTSPSPRDS